MSDATPTNADLLAAIQAGNDLLTQVRDGLNAVDYTLLASVMPGIGQVSDRVSSVDANVFATQQRVNSMSASMSAQLAVAVATLKDDITSTKAKLDTFETDFAKVIADASARNALDAQTLADLQALHIQVGSMSASIPSSEPAAPPADPAPAPSDPAPADPAPAPSGDTGAAAPAPSGDTGSTGATSAGDTGAAPPAGDMGSTGATAAPTPDGGSTGATA